MCGLVGFASDRLDQSNIDIVMALVNQVKIRGLHAFGASYCNNAAGDIYVDKFQSIDELTAELQDSPIYDCIIHTRYATSGDWKTDANNQPISIGDWHLAFNGIISMQTKMEMEADNGIVMQSDNDGEIFLQYIMAGGDPAAFVMSMRGSFAGLWYDDGGNLFALRNERRPLWYIKTIDAMYFASTLDVIRRAVGSVMAAAAIECEPGVVYDVRGMLDD